MNRSAFAALVSLALLAGCPKSRQPVAPLRPPTLPEAPESPYGYAASPLTAFADEITSLAIAGIEGKRLPMVSFPLWSGGRSFASTSGAGERRVTRDVKYVVEGRRIVEYTRTAAGGVFSKPKRRVVGRINRAQLLGIKAEPPLKVLGFFMLVSAILVPAQTEQATESRPGLVIDDAVLILDRRGLKIGAYSVKERSITPGPLPPTLGDLDEAFAPLVAAIRAAELPGNFVSDADIRDLGTWARQRFRRPDLATCARHQQRSSAFTGASPVGYSIKKISIAVLDARGKRRYLGLRARGVRTFGLQRLPLVRVTRLPGF